MLLELANVQKAYSQFSLSCSLKVEEGCVTGLIGQNGAGKSTVFKSILDLVYPDSGKISVLGKDHRDITVKDKEEIGVVLAGSGFSGYLTVRQIIPVLRSLYRNFDEKEFTERCKKFRLPTDQKIKEFSTGMRAKLNLLAAVCHGARLLLLDEPTAGLDVVARDSMLGILREFMETEGRGILISSHISSDLESLCDDLYMIDNGKIVLHEETDVLLDSYGLLKDSETDYRKLDKRYLLRVKKEPFGYSCLTNEKKYYLENYPEAAIEKGSVDEVITMMTKGEAI